MLGVLDPGLLFPPPNIGENVARWVEMITRWTGLIRDGPVRLATPPVLGTLAAQAWWSRRDQVLEELAASDSPLEHFELVRLMEECRGRLVEHLYPEHELIVVAEASSTPAYVASEFSDDEVAMMLDVIAETACVRSYTSEATCVVTRAESWSESPVGSILVEASAAEKFTAMADTVVEIGTVREFLTSCTSWEEICGWLMEHPETLVPYADLAVRAAHVALASGDEAELTFDVADGFGATVQRLGYGGQPGRARSCWRAMALVASGSQASTQSLQAHTHKTGSGGDAPPVTDSNGRQLWRGYLALNSPDAHRLFWWGGPRPEFLGVAGHDDPPPL
jgi:hypothetical protein